MREIIILLTIFIIASCKTEEVIQSVELEIHPAFHNYSKYKIEAKHDTSKMTFNLFELPNSIEISLSGKETKIKEEVIINPQIKELFNKIASFKDDGKRHYGYTDGASSTIIKNYLNRSDTFSIHVPIREENSIHYNYLDKLFDILLQTDKYQNQIYFETLKSYFDYGLPITQIKVQPKTYRIWGPLTTNEEQDLQQFTKSIKDNESIILDFRNYKGMGSSLYHEFIQLNKRNPNIYYVYDKEINEDFEYIANGKIYTSIEEVLEKFKEATDNR
ncbi:hypothetical protein [Portibacter lacus]|uniref:Uncharacterized protein n=1 Tax=Portibacter lacus TaxID=1099794 RepID=A0AA37WEL7_9BACT|nr:hypothetical protein [Portibacter lacus]GLR17532.1 hypothetical protein GCM10007940_21470 [Portibacter lacus]